MKELISIRAHVHISPPEERNLFVSVLSLSNVPLIFTLCALLFTLYSCTATVPEEAEEAGRVAIVFPDNSGATLPPNIAPLNFEIQEEGDAYVTRLSTRKGEELIIGGQTLDINAGRWRQLLQAAIGDTLFTDIYVRQAGRWSHFDRMANPVVADSIDPYITYRLIRPSYVMYEELTLNQRCLETFDERVIYENMSLSKGDNGQCINCHVPQGQGQSGRSQFHVRQAFGGTVFIHGDKVTKVNLKTASTLSAGVYPAWHPTLNLIAYSVNETGQAFHTLDPQKIEVIDYASDLILYDPERNEVLSIGRTANDYESFPCWSPDGRTLYYISAHHESVGDNIDADLDQNYQTLHYNIYARDFDAETRQFGLSRLVFDAESLGKSASVPRVSPDGKYLLFTLADYGQFHIWHKSADLAIVALEALENQEEPEHLEPQEYPDNLENLNSPESDSYHAWSSNGRWILFSSRRDDGNYTRLYLAYFDRDGHAHRPFLLPQRRPSHNQQLLRSYNAAEFMVQAVQPTQKQLLSAVCAEAQPVTYGGSALLPSERDSTAAPLRIAKQNHHNIYEND